MSTTNVIILENFETNLKICILYIFSSISKNRNKVTMVLVTMVTKETMVLNLQISNYIYVYTHQNYQEKLSDNLGRVKWKTNNLYTYSTSSICFRHVKSLSFDTWSSPFTMSVMHDIRSTLFAICHMHTCSLDVPLLYSFAHV